MQVLRLKYDSVSNGYVAPRFDLKDLSMIFGVHEEALPRVSDHERVSKLDLVLIHLRGVIAHYQFIKYGVLELETHSLCILSLLLELSARLLYLGGSSDVLERPLESVATYQ